MLLNRRKLISAAIGASLAPLPLASAHAAKRPARASAGPIDARSLGLKPDHASDQTLILEKALATASSRQRPLLLPPGRYRLGHITLPAGTALIGTPGRTTLAFSGEQPGLTANSAPTLHLQDLILDGATAGRSGTQTGLLRLDTIADTRLERLHVVNSRANGIHMTACGGRVADCTISKIAHAAVFSIDASGLAIVANTVSGCGNNGILVWRSEPGEDGTLVTGNRIYAIRADAGGSGQNGNGVNVYRAGDVMVSGNRMADCAYSAVRGNAASNIAITGNTCRRIGEVALYSEFGFQGALISGNIVDRAATGISVTNYNEGGRLAVIQGNLIRNLFRREHEPEDKRGVGIAVEADTAVTGNTIEGAPTAGIVAGWGKWMRNVAISGNMIRKAGIGIAITGNPEAGTALIANNLIAATDRGAIRTMRHHVAFGDDLARGGRAPSNIVITANAAN